MVLSLCGCAARAQKIGISVVRQNTRYKKSRSKMASSSHNNNNAELESLLRKVGLANLTERFQEEKLDVDSLMCATEKDLTRLGVSTIGDRVRLRWYA